MIKTFKAAVLFKQNQPLKINNDMNNLFALKGGNVFRYYVQKKYMDYWRKINIDIKNGNCSDILLLKPLINKSIMHNNDSFIKKYILYYTRINFPILRVFECKRLRCFMACFLVSCIVNDTPVDCGRGR